jgi:hypothetical protein
MKRRRTYREQFMMARAQLRAFDKLLRALPTQTSRSGGEYTKEQIGWLLQAKSEPTGRYVQLTTVRRGYADILTALDDTGQVWELHTELGEKVAGKAREITGAWWIKVTMEQR